MTARHRTLDNLAHRLDRAANIVPQVLDHLDHQRGLVTSIKAQDCTASSHGSGIGDPTLATVQQLDSIEYRRRELTDAIDTLEVCVRMLETNSRRAHAYRAGTSDADLDHLADEPRCLSCNQIPTIRTSRDGMTIDDGRCLDCGARHDLEQYERNAARLIERINRKAS